MRHRNSLALEWLIARRYALSVTGGEAIYERIATEHEAAVRGVLDATGRQTLMEHAPVIGRSIHARNPWTDVLNLTQIELLRRWREATEDQERHDLQQVLQASINGLAAAMQSTG
jgi:phosphoenolpyruvate carboxylase